MNNFHDLSIIDLTDLDESTIIMVNPEQNNSQSGVVQRIPVKVPPFWEESPDIWFAQVEAQFTNANVVTDDQKFNTVVGAIETKVLGKVRDAVLNPPDGRKYENLKAALQKEFEDSDYTKMKKLFSDLTLGDNKPSHLLNEMRRLGGTSVTEDVLKTLWIQQLPVHVRAIIATSTATLTELATTADKIHEVSALALVQQVDTVTSRSDDRLSTMEQQINQLVSAFKEMRNDDRSRSRSRSSNFQRNRSRTPSRANNTNQEQSDVCWYHSVIGKTARKCRSPCRYSNSKN